MKKIVIFILILFVFFITNSRLAYCQTPDSSSVDTTFVLKVDYSKNLDQMIADGNYNGKNDYINEKNFSMAIKLTGKKNEEAKIFNFNKNISSEEIIEKMENSCFRPATLPELLALGESNPEIQISVVALGTICYISYENEKAEYVCNVPYLILDPNDNGKMLGMINTDGDWNKSFYFLAIHK